MEEFKVIEKPDWVSWDDIRELLLAAHKKNIEKGMVMKIPQLPAEELEKIIGKDGRCYVAFANDKLIGTTSVRFYQGKSWYDRGQLVAHSMLSAILPKYQGLGITEDLNQLRDNFIREMDAKLIHADTAEDNEIVRINAKRRGFVDVAYQAYKTNHYSVIFVKWLGECPFSKKYIERKFKLSRVLVKLQYKRGRIERSFVLTLFCKVLRKILDV